MQIAFWSPLHGQCTVTSNTCILSAAIAYEYAVMTLIAHEQKDLSAMEFYMFEESQKNNEMMIDFNDNGLDALIRLAKNHILSPEIIHNYAVPILKDSQLDIIAGTKNKRKEELEDLSEVIIAIIEYAKKFYNIVALDLHSGYSNKLTNALISNSDLLIICVNQNKYVLDMFLNSKEYNNLINTNKCILLVSMYDQKSKYTIKNIKNKYDINIPIGAMPYNVNCKDALNNGRLMEFIIRNYNCQKRHSEYEFFSAIKRNIKIIMGEGDR